MPDRLLSWTVCAYRKPGLSEDEYHRYLSEKHAPLVKHLLAKYGIIRWSITHNTTATQALMARIVDPQFNSGVDYDCIINAVFPDIACYERMKQDPFYIEKVRPDHENFADTVRSKMSIGWIEDHVRDGRAVDS